MTQHRGDRDSKALHRAGSSSVNEQAYDGEFYERQVRGSLSSARVVLGMLYELYKPLSVVDVGCGRGAWLATADSLGSATLVGLDGHWVEREKLLSPRIDFRAVDLGERIEIPGRFDLCMSLEVAEHLPQQLAKLFVASLCEGSSIVLFSAAAKHQGGVGHVNEQPQSYWVGLFAANGFKCFDIFRARIWNHPQVEWWYKQNAFLFVREASVKERLDLKRLLAVQRAIIDAVHPLNLESKLDILSQRLREREAVCAQLEQENEALKDRSRPPGTPPTQTLEGLGNPPKR